MNVKIKKLHPDAVIPTYAHSSDACMDITAVGGPIYVYDKGYYEYSTGISMSIPEGFVGLIFPRSSISNKELLLTNHVGVIDSGYHGEIKFRFKLIGDKDYIKNVYGKGDRIGQIMILPYPKVTFVEVDELGESERNTGGFGSSGT